MVKQVQISVPPSMAADVVNTLSSKKYCLCLNVVGGEKQTLIVCKCPDKKLGGILYALEDLGVGTSHGHIDIIEIQSCVPPLNAYFKGPKKRQYKVSDRMSIEEIYQAIDKKIHLTFDYLTFVVIAAIIAATGLISDDATIIISAMIVSPLMGPIMGFTCGVSLRDRKMALKSLRTEVVGVVLGFFIGFIIGLIASPFNPNWPTTAMANRGRAWGLAAGAGMAIPSGAGLALAITGGISSTLVGVAISASLLPPVVNSGIFAAITIVKGARHDTEDWERYARICGFSFTLFAINFTLIFLVGLAFFKLKAVSPLKHRYDPVAMSDSQSSILLFDAPPQPNVPSSTAVLTSSYGSLDEALLVS